jgi:hypothetical protein
MFTSSLTRWFGTRPQSSRRERRGNARLGLHRLEDRVVPATFTVTTTGDNGGVDPAPFAGTGTLRQAILDANATPGNDTIAINVGNGLQTVAVAAALPTITDTVLLDGTTQPGYTGTPLIELNGSGAGASVDGLTLTARAHAL